MYTKCSVHALKYTKALLNSSKLITYNTSARVGYGSWCVTTENLIINCQEQIRSYETLVESLDHFSGVQNFTMLDNMVEPIPSLQDVKNQAEQFKT